MKAESLITAHRDTMSDLIPQIRIWIHVQSACCQIPDFSVAVIAELIVIKCCRTPRRAACMLVFQMLLLNRPGRPPPYMLVGQPTKPAATATGSQPSDQHVAVHWPCHSERKGPAQPVLVLLTQSHASNATARLTTPGDAGSSCHLENREDSLPLTLPF